MTIGPVSYTVIAFPGNRFTGKIVPEVEKLIANGTVRILDLVFVAKDEAVRRAGPGGIRDHPCGVMARSGPDARVLGDGEIRVVKRAHRATRPLWFWAPLG